MRRDGPCLSERKRKGRLHRQSRAVARVDPTQMPLFMSISSRRAGFVNPAFMPRLFAVRAGGCECNHDPRTRRSPVCCLARVVCHSPCGDPKANPPTAFSCCSRCLSIAPQLTSPFVVHLPSSKGAGCLWLTRFPLTAHVQSEITKRPLGFCGLLGKAGGNNPAYRPAGHSRHVPMWVSSRPRDQESKIRGRAVVRLCQRAGPRGGGVASGGSCATRNLFAFADF